ncbi:hypothetical protein HC026_02070 [Lactobacillus sp. LC28-10]|uniref:Uncharacterized protein n=1 Tax=Secundilactobacillus angelensis TaxID=2722706 RepID=A0ABX1KUW5_9LACO|nr:hypothetical protein [Secundilactobacillus angelensis]MCH5461486.1 hypothetical protein [Secundilactobacillus angelensis]NLR17701.1 hypothetical protein [Secundilactobacillus angelensis]
MLTKDYSTPVILEASNVIDGGKQFENVPVFLQGQVKELVESLGIDLSSNKPAAPSNVAAVKAATKSDTIVVTPKEA